jgi:hypothetical protein
MDSNLEENLIKKDKYQVFLCVCPANLPFSFATHPWFVINRKGTISRWGVSFSRRERDLSYGHLNKNLFPHFQGIEVFPFSQRYFWKGSVMRSIEGDDDSLAAQMTEFIEMSNKNYPFTQKYKLVGPNSNTYVQWVLNHYPQSNMRLPWNSFGKDKAGN